MDSYCFCQCKDTNSKAIHNSYCSILYLLFIVFANAKILIRKQFTTGSGSKKQNGNCFCQCKDTNSKAIHNLMTAEDIPRSDCFCQCKDTNSKAIHNCQRDIRVGKVIVFANAKILIRKQFTTNLVESYGSYALFLPMQRY